MTVKQLDYMCGYCGVYVQSAYHCPDCGNEPPWGCDCVDCAERRINRQTDAWSKEFNPFDPTTDTPERRPTCPGASNTSSLLEAAGFTYQPGGDGA